MSSAKDSQTATGFGLVFIHLGALAIFIPGLFSWGAVGVAIALYFLTGLVGITLGYHRLLTHRSFRVAKPLEYALASCGTLALQGGPIDWVTTHRAHHAHTDRRLDPHDANRGLRWTHIEWLFGDNDARVAREDQPRWSPDLVDDPVYAFLEANAVLLQVALGGVLLIVGGWAFVAWGIFARLVVTYHCTWLVNSASHCFGYRSYHTADRSTNNALVALVAFGEGWHNNHHAFPFSARHGFKWYEFDLTWAIVRGAERLGLVRDVKLPTRAMLERLDLRGYEGRGGDIGDAMRAGDLDDALPAGDLHAAVGPADRRDGLVPVD